MALYVDLESGDAVHIGADTVVRIEHKKGSRVRLRIESEYKVRLERPDKPARPDPTKAHPSLDRPGR